MLALLTCAQVLAVVAAVGWLSLRNGERAVAGLVADLQLEVADSSAATLRATLSPPLLINELNADLLDAALLGPHDFDALQRHFERQLERFPSAGYVSLGLSDGQFVGVERVDDGFRVERTDPALGGKGVWVLDAGERVGAPVAVVRGYRADQRPWYTAAIAEGGPTWSGIYQFSSREAARLGVTAVRPLKGDDGFEGVLGTDIVLAQLGRQLANPRLREGGRVFVLERDGALVASNVVDPPFSVDEALEAQRLAGGASGDPLTAGACRALEAQRGGLRALVQPVTLVLSDAAEGGPASAHAVPFNDGHGIDWILVVALPLADFSAELHVNTQQTVRLCAIALLVALVLAVLTARAITRPLDDLAASAQALAAGRWDTELPRDARTTEIAALTEAFATMRGELQRHAAALVRHATEADDAREAAEAANKAKSQFLANMSHELRTPLNAILGYAELLCETEDVPENVHQDLQRILVAGGHLLQLVAEVLDLTRIETGHLELHLAEVTAESVVRDAADAAHPLVRASGSDLEVRIEPGIAPIVTDAQKLRQCLLNLLSNSAKFTTRGTITLELSSGGDRVLFRVRDTGIGIPPESLKTLFAPFSQVNPSGSRSIGGAGLGLTITREFSRALGGDVSVESTLGEGSTFTIDLPRAGPKRRRARIPEQG